MTTTVWLARHGETGWAAEDRYNGRADTELSDRGRCQARQLSLRLSGEPIVAVYCSSLQRCVSTASIVAERHGLSPELVPELVEVDYGVWDGMLRTEIEARYPELYAVWTADPAGVLPPGGESGYSVLARALPALYRIVAAHAGQCVLVVAHKAVNRLLLCDLLSIPPRLYRARLGQAPCALNRIEWRGKDPMVTLLNDTSHYRCGEDG
ncbi:MAG: histidine phosphatase family protein [Anaerolineae bacterium]